MPDRVSLTAGAWITFSLTPPFPSSVWLPFIHPGASTDPHCASVSWHPLVFSFPCLWALHLELVYSWLYILIRLPLLIPSLRHTFFYTEVDRRWAHSCNLPATVPGEMPHEGFAVDWIAPKDVISRQPSWIIFPGLPCLAGCIHLPIKYNLRLPCGLPLHSNHPPTPPPPTPSHFFFFCLPPPSLTEIILSRLVGRSLHCEADQQMGDLTGCQSVFISLLSDCQMR